VKEDKAKEDKAKEDKERLNKAEMEKIEKEKLQKLEDMKKKKRAENRPVLIFHKPFPIKSWNLTLLTSFNLPDGGYAKAMCLNYEQDLLVIGTKQGFIHLYNIKTQDYIDTLKFHKSTLKCLAYLNDKVSVISGDNDGRLIKWNLSDRNYTELITNSKESITSIINNVRGEMIYVSCGNDILLYDIFAIENTFDSKIPMNDYIQCMVYLTEEKLLAVGLRSGEVKIVNPEKKKEVVHTFTNHSRKITDMCVIEYNKSEVLVACSKDKTITMYNIANRTLIKQFDSPNKNSYPRQLLYLHDEKTLLTTHSDGKFYVMNYHLIEKKRHFINIESEITSCFYTGDSSTLILGKKNHNIDVYTGR